MAVFTVAVREGPRVSRDRCDSLDELFERVERHAGELALGAGDRPVSGLFRSYEPIEQVAGRIEISGRRGRGLGHVRAGIDVRGDGSLEAFSGRVTRRVIEPAPGESAIAALRRVFSAATGGASDPRQ